jgi:uncharacterized membrane protein YdjX (TVP38/TMEM64 family)
MKHFYRALAIFLILIILITAIAGIFYGNTVKSDIFNKLEGYGLVAAFIISFAMEFIPQYFSPHIILVNASFLDFSPLSIFIAIVTGSLIGSIAGFQVGRKISKSVLVDIFGRKNYKKINEGMNTYGRWYVALAAVSPLPYVSMIFGSLNLSYKNFFFFGVIPRVIGFIVIAFLMNGIF